MAWSWLHGLRLDPSDDRTVVFPDLFGYRQWPLTLASDCRFIRGFVTFESELSATEPGKEKSMDINKDPPSIKQCCPDALYIRHYGYANQRQSTFGTGGFRPIDPRVVTCVCSCCKVYLYSLYIQDKWQIKWKCHVTTVFSWDEYYLSLYIIII